MNEIKINSTHLIKSGNIALINNRFLKYEGNINLGLCVAMY